ncbi:MAG: YgaP-like transmembrane domain [Candidatus Dormibacteria bacterium]|jgi:Protein of unknown function (DUF2892)
MTTAAHPSVTVAGRARPRLHRPRVNITPLERVARIAIGIAAIVAGAVLLASVGSPLAAALEALLVAAGLDLALTGALGHCPLYRSLGYTPRSLRRSA